MSYKKYFLFIDDKLSISFSLINLLIILEN